MAAAIGGARAVRNERDRAHLPERRLPARVRCQVVAVDAEKRDVALNQTVFFPTGGGQPQDTGEFGFAKTRAEVVDVGKDKEGIV